MSLATPIKVEKLQKALHAKAKEEPECRFHQLHDKLYRADILEFAYRLCRSNQGAPGVDGMTFEQIESVGLEKWLGEVTEELRRKTYQADPVRRVWIPKPDGARRPLGIPTIRDRVVQTAVVLLLDPIVEVDLQPEQYAYRRGRSAQDAVRHVHRLASTGHTEVVDADLSGYFDTIPHAELMRSVSRRVSDRHLLSLLKQWLVAAVEEDDHRGRRTRTTRAKDEKRGVPQGAPISPLLSSLYMRRFLLGWKVLGHESRLKAHIVNYADDFVICCRGTGAEAMEVMRTMMESLKLTVNEEKTGLRYLPGESVDFLGYTIERCYSVQTGKGYIGTRPSSKSIRRVTVRISELTASRMTLLDAGEVVGRLNRLLTGPRLGALESGRRRDRRPGHGRGALCPSPARSRGECRRTTPTTRDARCRERHRCEHRGGGAGRGGRGGRGRVAEEARAADGEARRRVRGHRGAAGVHPVPRPALEGHPPPLGREAMNKPSLARHALKFDPFSPGIPTEAIHLAPAVEHFCWRVETQLVPDGGFALVSGEPGTGKSVTLRALAERLERVRDVSLGTLTHASSNLGDFYREMGDVFGVAIRSHNRWGGFKKLRERWIAHLEATHVRQVLLIDEAQEMPPAVLNELRLLSSDRFDSRSLLTVVLAGDGRLIAKLGREELLPLGSRIRVRLPLEPAEAKAIGETLTHLMAAAGNPALMTEELVRTIAEHAMGNHRIAVSAAAELMAAAEASDHDTLDEAFYLEVFGARGARRAKRGR